MCSSSGAPTMPGAIARMSPRWSPSFWLEPRRSLEASLSPIAQCCCVVSDRPKWNRIVLEFLQGRGRAAVEGDAAGGHFAPMEEPDRLVEDVRAVFRSLR